MTYETIQARLRKVVQARSLGLESWQYRRLTSSFGAEPRTYSPWAQANGLPTGKGFRQVYDNARATWKQAEVQRFRTPDDDPDPWLAEGDQLMDAAGEVWAVLEAPSSGPGTVAYTIMRDQSMLGDMDRKGGV